MIARATLAVAALGALVCSFGCNDHTDDGDALVTRGRSVYVTNCVICHNPDPTRDGNVGPATHGASVDLLRARLMNASYPRGYAPKRTTKLMPRQPHLAKDIEALHAFLAK